jgi:tRNA (guanine37-N1)-methyltransferase
LRIDVVTIFPEFFHWPFSHSLLKIAQSKRKVRLEAHNLRDFTEDSHRTVDERPFGGGAGMVMKPEPVFKCVESLPDKGWVILLSPRGRPLTQEAARRLVKKRHLVLICGHYEGVDERVSEYLIDEEISIGDFVTMGGEAPALCLIESVVRLFPGVLGNPDSLKEESFGTHLNKTSYGLEFPQYTRPRSFRNWQVPEVLVSGNHRAIEAWRRKESAAITRKRRPGLLRKQRQA